MQGRPVYPLATHYCQTWQHLPDYGAYHATLIADSALPGKWQPGEEVVYLLVFEGEQRDGATPATEVRCMLTSRLSETLTIPIMDNWFEELWKVGVGSELISELTTGGDCLAGYRLSVSEKRWE